MNPAEEYELLKTFQSLKKNLKENEDTEKSLRTLFRKLTRRAIICIFLNGFICLIIGYFLGRYYR